MSVLDQKRAINNQINELFRDVILNYEFQRGASVQDLLNMKNRLTEAFENAMQIRIQAKQFNETQTIERNKINIGTNSTLGRSLGTIKLNLSLLRDIFLKRNNSSLNQSQINEIQDFLNSRIVTKFVGNAQPVLPQVGSPVRRERSPSVARRYSNQSPVYRNRNHGSTRKSPFAAVATNIRTNSQLPKLQTYPVVSPANVIINHESPTPQTGCFGKMCATVKSWRDSIKSKFSRTRRVHPDTNVGGKRKLRRRTRRTHRGRRSRLH